MSEIKALKKLREYADDVCSKRDQRELRQYIDELEAEVNDNYMRLPMDADGMPIHVGDVMCSAGIREKGHRVIVSALFEDGFVEYGSVNGFIGPLLQEDWVHVKPRTLEDVIAEYTELANSEEVKGYLKVSDELRRIQHKQFSDRPELELYKSVCGYKFYIELPYDELLIMTKKVDVKHYGYSYRYEHPDGTTTYSCLSLCGYSKERIIEMIEKSIEEIRELLGVDGDDR